MRYLILLLILSGCGTKGGGGGAASSGAAQSRAACSDGSLTGTYYNASEHEIVSVDDCQFTSIDGIGNTACHISGSIYNSDNNGGNLSATVDSTSVECYGISSGTCNFSINSGGNLQLSCPSLALNGEYIRQ